MLKYSTNLPKSFISLFASFKLWTGKSFDQWFPTLWHVCCLVNDAIQLSWSILKQEVMVYTNISRAILKNIYHPHTMLRRPLMSPTLALCLCAGRRYHPPIRALPDTQLSWLSPPSPPPSSFHPQYTTHNTERRLINNSPRGANVQVGWHSPTLYRDVNHQLPLSGHSSREQLSSVEKMWMCWIQAFNPSCTQRRLKY